MEWREEVTGRLGPREGSFSICSILHTLRVADGVDYTPKRKDNGMEWNSGCSEEGGKGSGSVIEQHELQTSTG
jgi:hypothetical protein